ncbi:DUF1330 domain-containing protein [Kitasatospora aureofaciens]|uniref:DUF1330 domain-containing protein n=1 Tax=Kitasatospora aureofaciens TaxID=1894 RepID=UPI001C43DC47|nr:DUF1330 domain-containing protein [Kitasatospora aureofaciens]MBV6703064.1 DUF1330 domain-containing protein [Kitasatospora aureofaciens]
MTALLILNYDVTDPQRLDAYRQAATPVLLGPDSGELLASTDRTVHLHEGGRPAGGTHTVVLRFRDADQARAVYESSRYRELLEERLAATVPFAAMIVPEISG